MIDQTPQLLFEQLSPRPLPEITYEFPDGFADEEGFIEYAEGLRLGYREAVFNEFGEYSSNHPAYIAFAENELLTRNWFLRRFGIETAPFVYIPVTDRSIDLFCQIGRTYSIKPLHEDQYDQRRDVVEQTRKPNNLGMFGGYDNFYDLVYIFVDEAEYLDQVGTVRTSEDLHSKMLWLMGHEAGHSVSHTHESVTQILEMADGSIDMNYIAGFSRTPKMKVSEASEVHLEFNRQAGFWLEEAWADFTSHRMLNELNDQSVRLPRGLHRNLSLQAYKFLSAPYVRPYMRYFNGENDPYNGYASEVYSVTLRQLDFVIPGLISLMDDAAKGRKPMGLAESIIKERAPDFVAAIEKCGIHNFEDYQRVDPLKIVNEMKVPGFFAQVAGAGLRRVITDSVAADVSTLRNAAAKASLLLKKPEIKDS